MRRMDRPAAVGPRPHWWPLYLTTLTLVVLIGLLEAYVPATVPRELFEIIVVVCAFAVMGLWLHSNRGARDLDRGRRHD